MLHKNANPHLDMPAPSCCADVDESELGETDPGALGWGCSAEVQSAQQRKVRAGALTVWRIHRQAGTELARIYTQICTSQSLARCCSCSNTYQQCNNKQCLHQFGIRCIKIQGVFFLQPPVKHLHDRILSLRTVWLRLWWITLRGKKPV